MIFGIYLVCNDAGWYSILIAPFYAVGLVYGITKVGPWIARFLGSMLKAAASLFFFRLFAWIIAIVVIIPLGIAVLLAVCWIVGFPLAIIDTVRVLLTYVGTRSHYRRKRRDDKSNDDYYWEEESDDDEYEYDEY